VGLPIEETLRRCPFAAAFSTAREEEERASDAPCRSAAKAEALATLPGPLPPLLRQKGWVSRPEAPFLDELPARCLLTPTPRTRTRHRFSGFATRDQLPTLFRSCSRGSPFGRTIEEELDSAAFTSSSLASAQRHTPLADFCNRNDPQARPANRRNPARGLALSAFAENTDARPVRRPFGATRPSCHGSGAGTDLRLSPRRPPAPLTALARAESLAPTRLARTPPVVSPGPRWPEWPVRSVELTRQWLRFRGTFAP
jgi:hypothetical protein